MKLRQKLFLNQDDAILVIRGDGEIQLLIDEINPDERDLVVLGLAMCLENADWKEKLITRTKQKMAEYHEAKAQPQPNLSKAKKR